MQKLDTINIKICYQDRMSMSTFPPVDSTEMSLLKNKKNVYRKANDSALNY